MVSLVKNLLLCLLVTRQEAKIQRVALCATTAEGSLRPIALNLKSDAAVGKSNRRWLRKAVFDKNRRATRTQVSC